MLRRSLFTILTAIGTAAASSAAEAPTAKYVAVFTDGSRVEGQTITGWQSHPGTPALDSTVLDSDGRPLRWLRDESLASYRPDSGTPGFVDLVGGDRLVGRVEAFVQEAPDEATGPPPHLVVRTDSPVNLPGEAELRQVRVLAHSVRRIVLAEHTHGPLPASTLLCRDGRRFAYRNLRWDQDNVRFLTDNSVHEMNVSEIVQIAFPHRDQWTVYFEQLAVLSPECSARLMCLTTIDGLIVTASRHRFRAAATGNSADPNNWYHMVQPVWSLDPIWLHFPTIRTRLYFAPEEIPLSQLQPERGEQATLLGAGWPWRRDCNVRGGVLHAGGQTHGWGIGVRAPQSLWFALPEGVQSFRSRAGLDSLAGNGGCAQVLIYVNELAGQPLYQSPHIVGSQQVVDTGTLSLSGPSRGQQFLILVADPANHGRPRGADPLNVRDTVDWLEPILSLDPTKVKAEISRLADRENGSPATPQAGQGGPAVAGMVR